MPLRPDIEAEVTFRTAQEGGRSTPAFSGYRPQFYYKGEDWDAQHDYPDVKEVKPGDRVRALLSFGSPEFHRGRVHVGTEFEIREGSRVVGKGRVTRLLGVEAEIRQLFFVASNYMDEAVTLAGNSDPDFRQAYEARTMYEFQKCFSHPVVGIHPGEERCVKIVADAGSAAVRLETILECLFNDFEDKTIGPALGERSCRLLRHAVAHRESYVIERDAQAKQELQGKTPKFILEELMKCFLKIREYLKRLGILAESSPSHSTDRAAG